MKVLFIESKLKNYSLDILDSEFKKLPKKLFLAYTIQFKDLIPSLKEKLIQNKIEVVNTQQVLGCSKVNTNLPILLLTQGKFHAINLYTQSSEIFLIENNTIIQVPKSDLEKIQNKRRTALIKFLSAKKIGILVSTKAGQEHLREAIKLCDKLKSENKSAYIFITNNIDINQFENFNIDSWVNTACPGLAYDNPSIINLNEIR